MEKPFSIAELTVEVVDTVLGVVLQVTRRISEVLESLQSQLGKGGEPAHLDREGADVYILTEVKALQAGEGTDAGRN